MFRYPLSNFSKFDMVIVIVSVALLYFLFGFLGLMLALPTTNASVIWPPSGLALAAVLLFGYRTLIGIFFGSFILNTYVLMQLDPHSTELWKIVSASLVTGAGAALQANFAGALIYYCCGKDPFGSTINVFKFLGIVMVCSLISATLGTTAVSLTGIIQWNLYLEVFWTRWLGETLGVFVVTPLIWAWVTAYPTHFIFHKFLEAIALGLSLLFVSYLNFHGTAQFSYLFLPCLFWAAVRFKFAGATLAVFWTAILVVFATINQYGLFIKASLNESLFFTALFIMVITATVLALVAELNKGTKKKEIWKGTRK